MKISQFVARTWCLALFFLSFVPIAAGQCLGEKGDRAGILVGTAVRPHQLSAPVRRSTLAGEFNLPEAENAMKWAVIRPERMSRLSQVDRIVNFARTPTE